QCGGGSRVPDTANPKTPEVIVSETPRKGVTPDQIMAVIPAEIRATVKLYLDGKIRQWYSRGDGKGVIFVVDAKTEDEARAIMETLPLAKEHLMDHQYIPVGPLMPLRALIGPGAQQSDSSGLRKIRYRIGRWPKSETDLRKEAAMSLIVIVIIVQAVSSTLAWLGFYIGIRALPGGRARQSRWIIGSAVVAAAWLVGVF